MCYFTIVIKINHNTFEINIFLVFPLSSRHNYDLFLLVTEMSVSYIYIPYMYSASSSK